MGLGLALPKAAFFVTGTAAVGPFIAFNINIFQNPRAPIGHDLVTGDLRMFTMSYGYRWRAHRTIMHRLLAPKPTLEFVPSQEFEVKQLLHQLAFENGDDHAGFFYHVRRMSFRLSRRPRTAAAWTRWATLISPGAFIEDDIPPLAQILPKFLQPSRRQAAEYAKIVLRGEMRAWNQIKDEVSAGIAAPSFGRDLAESDFREQGLTDEDATWITGGLVEAGAEITAVVIYNLLLYLAATPAAQTKAHAELERVIGRKGGMDTSDRAFEVQSAFRGPKPFLLQLVPRSEAQKS
ncbi:cytochrome P450 [Podospora didyma]|uniref:Cytochrome P450 n=1 Tax=Podospora didyma TaxID=330526 RepID=A0AAE0P8D4_9PEZI|nr:cytochrome P450 [Podospora didyma]